MKDLITSRNNKAVKELSSLKEKKYRDERGTYIVEGFKMVREAYAAGKKVVRLMGTEEGLEELGKSVADIDLSEAIAVTEEILKYVSDCKTPQGVVAELEKEDFGITKPEGVSALLDGISDPGNMGTIERTCVAVGVKDAYLLNCCDPYSTKAVRSSMSGIYSLRLHFITADDLVEVFDGVKILACDMNGKNVFGYNAEGNFCVAVGNEANGLSEEVKKAASEVVKLPMTDKVESLNAGVAFSVVLYELTKGKCGK